MRSVKSALSALALSALLAAPAACSALEMTCTVKSTQYVNVRSAPSDKASAIGRLHNGDTIDANAEDVTRGYIKINHKGMTGYVSVRYFEVPDVREYGVSANGRVKLRKSINGDRAGWLDPGTHVRVYAWQYDKDGTLWARVSGGYWIKSDCLCSL